MTKLRDPDVQAQIKREDDLRRQFCRIVRETEWLALRMEKPFNDSAQVKVCGDQKEWPWEPCDMCCALASGLINLQNGSPVWLSDPETGHPPVPKG